jgi:glycosyltransferase involved in cell wall biosynthesis
VRTALSILIPTYNYDVYPLVKRLHGQATRNGINFEILVMDDGSPTPSPENESINELSGARYQKLEKNIGRSAVRNRLAATASHGLLLFLDADTAIIREDFLVTYLDSVKPEDHIVYGGIVYQEAPPPADQRLRWVYGNKREALAVNTRKKQPHLRFLTLNFLIRKSVFEQVRFNEDIPNLRHEDTLFALDTAKHGLRIEHIDNPVMHLGLESSVVFLQKSREACDALILLVKKKLIDPENTALSRFATRYGQTLPGKVAVWLYNGFARQMERQLLSAKPSLALFDLYRLGYYLKKSKA